MAQWTTHQGRTTEWHGADLRMLLALQNSLPQLGHWCLCSWSEQHRQPNKLMAQKSLIARIDQGVA
eukprot:341016-Prorocentrum_lima.AAC.1